MNRNVNPKILLSQITAIENKYQGKTSTLIANNKLTNIILGAPDEYDQTIYTSRQLATGGVPPRETTVNELQTTIYEYYRARNTTQEGIEIMRCLSM